MRKETTELKRRLVYFLRARKSVNMRGNHLRRPTADYLRTFYLIWDSNSTRYPAPGVFLVLVARIRRRVATRNYATPLASLERVIRVSSMPEIIKKNRDYPDENGTVASSVQLYSTGGRKKIGPGESPRVSRTRGVSSNFRWYSPMRLDCTLWEKKMDRRYREVEYRE